MPTTFTKPGELEWPVTLLATVMKDNHPTLAELGVRVGVLFAISEDGPAVKHAGYPALATIKPVPLKDRLTKGFDAELVIDESEWKDLSKESQAALLDHELSHLRVVSKKDKESGRELYQVDDLGRPKLKTIPGDFNAGDGFKDVIGRHGDNAVEFVNIRRAHAIAAAALEGEVG